MVLGGFEHHQFFRVDGEVVARVVLGVDRQWPPFASRRCARHRAAADTPAHAERSSTHRHRRLLVGAVQARPRGRPRLMEVNARRPDARGRDSRRRRLLAHGTGVGPRPRHRRCGARLGVRMGWLAGDLRLVLAAAAHRDAPRPDLWTPSEGCCPTTCSQGVIEGFDLHDPMPMVSAIAQGSRRCSSAACVRCVCRAERVALSASRRAPRAQSARWPGVPGRHAVPVCVRRAPAAAREGARPRRPGTRDTCSSTAACTLRAARNS